MLVPLVHRSRECARPRLALGFILCSIIGASTAEAQILGANYNGQARRVDTTQFAPSLTSWSRTFYDILQMENVANLSTQTDIVGLRRAADAGQQLMVSLKWNFKGFDQSVPAPGSARETALFNRATATLQAIGRPVNTIVLGNEPMWETLSADLERPGAGQPVPVVRFTERLRDHLQATYAVGQSRSPEFFIGALNSLDASSNQNKVVVQEMLRLARDDSRFAGLDIHVHFNPNSEARAQMQYARQQLGATKDLLVTEYSPVWRYKANLNTAIGATAAGQQFAQQYGYSPTMQVDEYLTNAFAQQVSRTEWTAFIGSQPWYDPNHVSYMHGLFREFGVSIATQGFNQTVADRGFDATQSNYSPYNLNWLYIPALVDEPNPLDSHNAPYMEDWLAAQQALADLDRNGAINLTDFKRLVGNRAISLKGVYNQQALTLGDLNLDDRIDDADARRFASLYQSASGVSLASLADFNGDGALNGQDGAVLTANLLRNLQSEGIASSLWKFYGDVDLSGQVNRTDFRLFKEIYEATTGASATSAVGAVPELSSGSLTVAICGGVWLFVRSIGA